MVPMVEHEAFACRCGKGDVVLRQSYKRESQPPKDYECEFFLWKETRLRKLMSSLGAQNEGIPINPINSSGASSPQSYFPGPSTPPNTSSGSSKNAECLNCKYLREKISVLKGAVDVHMHPEFHIVNSTAIINEILNDMEKLDLK